MSIKKSLEKLKAAMQRQQPPMDPLFTPPPGSYGPWRNCCTRAMGDGTYSVVCNGKVVAHGTINSLGPSAINLPNCK